METWFRSKSYKQSCARTEPYNNKQRTTRTTKMSDATKARGCTRMRIAEPPGREPAPNPTGTYARGVEARCSGKHAGQVTALYHTGQLAVHIGEAGGTLVPWLGESGVGGFAEESHGTGIELPKGVKGDRTERIFRAGMVIKVVPTLVYVPKSSDMARGRAAE
jgi:hypothetical protein